MYTLDSLRLYRVRISVLGIHIVYYSAEVVYLVISISRYCFYLRWQSLYVETRWIKAGIHIEELGVDLPDPIDQFRQAEYVEYVDGATDLKIHRSRCSLFELLYVVVHRGPIGRMSLILETFSHIVYRKCYLHVFKFTP